MGRLDAITDWDRQARNAGFRAAKLARSCRISLRQLERFFVSEMGQRPQEWLDAIRLAEAKLLIAQGKSVKEVAFELQYRQPSHFSRAFKRAHGIAPSFARTSEPQPVNVAIRYEMSAKDMPVLLKDRRIDVLIQLHEKQPGAHSS